MTQSQHFTFNDTFPLKEINGPHFMTGKYLSQTQIRENENMSNTVKENDL